MICKKDHRFLEEFKDLPDAQDNKQNDRHKCCGCAFLAGLKDALTGRKVAATLDKDIPESQAGSGRHKDAYAAYQKGYQTGEKYRD